MCYLHSIYSIQIILCIKATWFCILRFLLLISLFFYLSHLRILMASPGWMLVANTVVTPEFTSLYVLCLLVSSALCKWLSPLASSRFGRRLELAFFIGLGCILVTCKVILDKLKNKFLTFKFSSNSSCWDCTWSFVDLTTCAADVD